MKNKTWNFKDLGLGYSYILGFACFELGESIFMGSLMLAHLEFEEHSE